MTWCFMKYKKTGSLFVLFIMQTVDLVQYPRLVDPTICHHLKDKVPSNMSIDLTKSSHVTSLMVNAFLQSKMTE